MSAPAIRLATDDDRDGVIALIHALNLHEAALSADRRTDEAAAQGCHAAITARIAKDGGALKAYETSGFAPHIITLAKDL